MASPPNSMHVVFSAECNHALTWQAVGLFASHAALRHPGNITRLLACSDEQLASYRGLGVGPRLPRGGCAQSRPSDGLRDGGARLTAR